AVAAGARPHGRSSRRQRALPRGGSMYVLGGEDFDPLRAHRQPARTPVLQGPHGPAGGKYAAARRLEPPPAAVEKRGALQVIGAAEKYGDEGRRRRVVELLRRARLL